MKSNKETKRKSHYNENRDSYLSIDGKYYCYKFWDTDTKRIKTERIEIKNDSSVDWTVVLDDLDHAADLNDRYANEARDKVFDAKLAQYEANPYEGDEKNPWEDIGDNRNNPVEILFSEAKPENEKAALVRKVVDEKLTNNQKNLYYDHFGMNKKLVEIAREEGEQTGKAPSNSAMNNRKNKILQKISKFFEEK
ncbi:MAG: hypothetical protein J6I62_02255 [Selenomonadaceae bacterium]|nr:hypothetical protein [Selenomonadaceae bacterium]